jgi:hypothetical protein
MENLWKAKESNGRKRAQKAQNFRASIFLRLLRFFAANWG